MRIDVEDARRLVVGHQRVPHPDLDGGHTGPRHGGQDPHHVRLGDLDGNRMNVDAVHQAGGDVGLLTGAELAHLGGLEDPPGGMVEERARPAGWIQDSDAFEPGAGAGAGLGLLDGPRAPSFVERLLDDQEPVEKVDRSRR